MRDKELIEFPSVAIVMPLHNCEATVIRSLKSILHQTYEHYHVYCVLNNCTDDTRSVIEELIRSTKTTKITITTCDDKGIVPALNTGMTLALGSLATFIARQDGDDYWHPSKLQKQVSFFKNNEDVDILGTQINLVKKDTFDLLAFSSNPIEDEECKKWLLSGQNPIAHPSVMFRSDIVNRTGLYDDLFPIAEDMWFWLKASKHYTFANLNEKLVDYTSSHNPNYTPVAPQLASHVMNQILQYFPKKEI